MFKLIAVITPDTGKWYDIAQAWEKAGAPGVTIIDSHGLYRLNQKANVEIDPTSFSMASILRQLDETSRIVFSVVSETQADALLNIITTTIDLNAPDTGIAFVIDVERVIGLRQL